MSSTESRKRSRTEDGDGVRAKKRALTEERSLPSHVNGTTPAATTSSEADEPKDSDSLETFRKDAIYRRMKHYSRENERSQAKIIELERRRHTCEAGLAALEACWSQLVDTIRSLVKPDALPSVDVKSEEIYDLSAHVSDDPDPAYVDSLRSKMQATQHLITAFVQLGGKAQSVLLSDDMYTQCQRAQTQCSSLRSEVSFIRAKLHHSETDRERLNEELIAAQTRIDRLQSKTVTALNSSSSKPKPAPSPDVAGGSEEGSGEVKDGERAKDESSPPRDTPSSPLPPDSTIVPGGVVNGVHAEKDDESQIRDVEATSVEQWKAVAEVREKKIAELHKRCLDLADEVNTWKVHARTPSEKIVKDSPHFKLVYDWYCELAGHEEGRKKELAICKDEVEQLTKARQEWHEDLLAQHEKATQEFKTALQSRDANLARIREQRDQLLSEVNERKQKDSVKLSSLNEWRTLAESREDRIDVLLHEVNRLKTHLAAEAGDDDLMVFLFDDGPANQPYVDDLRKRLTAAESRADALSSSLSQLSKTRPDVAQHIRTEAQAKEQLALLTDRIQAYESTFGDASSSGSPDVQALTGQLRMKEEELKRLRLREKQREQAESSLYTELDKLSAAWEALDKQVKSKVFELSAMEERVAKAGLDRAKLENKFYAAMRDKEAIENERKNLTRSLEKQAKMVERLVESEGNLNARVAQFQRETDPLRVAIEKATNHAEVKTQEAEKMKTKAETEHQLAETYRQALNSAHNGLKDREGQLLKVEESIAIQKTEVERLMSKARTAEKTSTGSTGSTNQKESPLQSELDKCMALLQCSTCKSNMRTTVITKCMHSFCKACVDSRIASRQRKCPACNISFSQGEVQPLYFQ